MTKKLFLTVIAAAMAAASGAQRMENLLPLNEQGNYEQKQVVEVDSTSKDVLFDRVMDFLPGWAGADGQTRGSIEASNKERGTIVYKGSFSLGTYLKNNLITTIAVQREAEFLINIRCKDGKAQTVITVQKAKAHNLINAANPYLSMKELRQQVVKAKGKKRVRGKALLANIEETVTAMQATLKEKITCSTSDLYDDF